MRDRLDTVVMLSLDCVRRESLGCYAACFDDAPEPRTPNVDWIARGGTAFNQAITQAPYTPAAHASIFTGLDPYHHGLRAIVGRLCDSATTLAEILALRGHATAAFIGAHALSRRYGLDRGFNVYDQEFAESNENWILGARRGCEESTERAIDWLGGQTGPSLLFLHYFDCHDVAGQPDTARPTFQIEQMSRIDREIGRLLECLDGSGRLSGALFVVFSDHGDAFGEHGEHCHREFLYDTTLRIPLIVRGGRHAGGITIEEQVRSIDILPTLLDELAIPLEHPIDGLSLGEMLDDPVDRPAYSETCHEISEGEWDRLRLSFASFRRDGWKFILDRLTGARELYFLAADPGERTNLARIQHQLCDRLAAELSSLADSTGIPPVTMSEEEREVIAQRLKSLGYLEA